LLSWKKHITVDKNVQISDGARTIQQYINTDLVDEVNIHLAPILKGMGIRLLENIEKEKFTVEIRETASSPTVTHLFYKIKNSKN
jgi:dihydrofolate reductase